MTSGTFLSFIQKYGSSILVSWKSNECGLLIAVGAVGTVGSSSDTPLVTCKPVYNKAVNNSAVLVILMDLIERNTSLSSAGGDEPGG